MFKEGIRHVRAIANTVSGVERARKWSGRFLVESREVAYFSLFYSHLMHSTPDSGSVTNTCIIQDIIERQNRTSENLALDSKTGPWQPGCFAEEYSGALTKIGYFLNGKYGRAEGVKRLEYIESSLEDWFRVSQQSDEKLKAGFLDEPRIYREMDDRSWLKMVMAVFTDGDEELVNKHFKTIFAATLLLQLADDFANTYRHQRRGKLAFFAQGERQIKVDDDWKRKIEVLAEEGAPYFSNLEVNRSTKLAIKLIWFARCISSHALTSKRTDDKYGDDEFVAFCNQFESNVNKVWYNLSRVRNGS